MQYFVPRINSEVLKTIYRTIAAMCGAIVGYFEPVFPFIVLVTLFVLVDCWTAWRLSTRVRLNHPGATDGKFKSRNASRIIHTLMVIYACTILAFLSDEWLFPETDLHLANVIAAASCFTQGISILENESSENSATWAKLLQKILLNKAERHFDVDLSEFKHKEESTSVKEESTSVKEEDKKDNSE